VNNAGTIEVGPYDELAPEAIEATMRVDLVAPMVLTRLALPAMLAQGRGHVVNMSSLAGRFGLPGIETYCAAKAGIANFTAALRAAYHSRGVSASAILPGYVHGAGMYQRVQAETHLPTPRSQGSSSPEDVARAVVRAIRQDLAEVLVSPRPIRPLIALQGLFPGVTARLVPTLGGDWYQRAGQALKQRS
jgi:short-subunit dehydrogenase